MKLFTLLNLYSYVVSQNSIQTEIIAILSAGSRRRKVGHDMVLIRFICRDANMRVVLEDYTKNSNTMKGTSRYICKKRKTLFNEHIIKIILP